MNSINNPKTIDWFVTSVCNLHCDFCYGPVPEKEDPGRALQIVKKINESGSPNITLCGGEPFLHQKISDIIVSLKEGGKKVYVSTNGMFLNKYKSILQELSMISISLDGDNSHLYKRMRGEQANFDQVIKNIYYIKETMPEKLKIATVVTKVNLNNIISLGKLVNDIKPTVWRVFQFTPRMRGFKNSQKYEISNNEFLVIKNQLLQRFPESNISFSSVSENSTCFILSQYGEILLPHGTGYQYLGNCFSEAIDLCWQKKWPNKELHYRNKNWMV